MRLLFALAWLAQLIFLAGTWHLVPDTVGTHDEAVSRDPYMALTLAMSLFTPWLATHGSMLVARRSPHWVSLPYAHYWMAPERREQTLDDMGRRLAALGLIMVLLFAGQHGWLLQQAHPDWPQLPVEAWAAGALGQGLGFALWLVAIMRRFARPPTVANPADRAERRIASPKAGKRHGQP